MRNQEFQELLFKSAVYAIACDGQIDEDEVVVIREMTQNEIYFQGFDFEEPLTNHIKYLKEKKVDAINEYISELSNSNLNSNQELLLIEVLIRAIESDNQVVSNEILFLQMIIAKLKTNIGTIISKFPKHIKYFIDNHNNQSLKEFTNHHLTEVKTLD